MRIQPVLGRSISIGIFLFVSVILPNGSRLFALERQYLAGHVPKAAVTLQSVGSVPASKQMRLAIALPLRNQDGLSKLLAELYDPNSPRYRQYLTPEQFTDAFGPTEADYNELATFAEANGLRVTGRHPNRMLLDVSGSVENIEKALHLHLLEYSHPKENRTFFAPDAEPALDLKVPVLHISGLTDFEIPRPVV
jgi:subtilase family serine protease